MQWALNNCSFNGLLLHLLFNLLFYLLNVPPPHPLHDDLLSFYIQFYGLLSSVTTNPCHTREFWGGYIIFLALTTYFRHDVCCREVFTRLKMWFVRGTWTAAAVRTMGVDDEMDLGGVVYCQMGKIKYRHETGAIPRKQEKTQLDTRASCSQSQERNVSFTPFTFF